MSLLITQIGNRCIGTVKGDNHRHVQIAGQGEGTESVGSVMGMEQNRFKRLQLADQGRRTPKKFETEFLDSSIDAAPVDYVHSLLPQVQSGNSPGAGKSGFVV